MPSATDAPRCPLGFTGTPPAGHPSIPGLHTSASASASASKDPSSSSSPYSRPLSLPAKAHAILANIFSQPWSSTHTMLVLDALFLVGVTLVAIYWDRIPALKGLRGPSSGPAGHAGPRSAGAGAGAGAGGASGASGSDAKQAAS
ncbi:hypothetical protein OC834_004684 [Tilletia horrida]|nr:hypothetical protein OC834_004684 [Tilletia horrida]